ncbi:MAG: hypothetical protein IAE82_02695, partial [Opitutaceae bacterium]|nr:hypothetical protein [Opitutaceae bacterium]
METHGTRVVRRPVFGTCLAVLAASVLVSVVVPGCRTVEATAEIPGSVVRTVTGTKPEKPPPDPVVLQQEVFRFVDDFSAFAGAEYRRLQGKFPTVSDDRMLESQINLEYRLLEIASGANAFGNLVDLTFSVVLIRHQLETYALPLDTEGHLRPTVAALEQYQRQIMTLVRETLGDAQQQQLRNNIIAWVDANISSESGLHARYPGPISELLSAEKAKRQGALTNLINSLMLDPFAGLDPTVREVAQARLFAERAMFVAQRMPRVLQLELELFKRRTLATPEIARLVANVDTVTRTVERVGTVVETLPDRLRDEREGLTDLVRETRATLDASTRAMEQVNTVVLSTDAFLGHLGDIA